MEEPLQSTVSASSVADLLPIAISIIALVASIFSVGWTVHRDVRRPRFRVSIAKKLLIGGGGPMSDPFLIVEALNLGPLPNRAGLIFARGSWWRRFRKEDGVHAMITHDPDHRATSPASVTQSRIEVGDQVSYAFPYNKDSFLKENFIQVGIADGYGRMHWAPKRQLKKLRENYMEDFGSADQGQS